MLATMLIRLTPTDTSGSVSLIGAVAPKLNGRFQMFEAWFQEYTAARIAEGLKGKASRALASEYFDCGDTPKNSAAQDRINADRPLCEVDY